MVKDIFPGVSNVDIHGLVDMDGVLYFSARTATSNGATLWKSDGTEAGTVEVFGMPGSLDIYPIYVIGSHLYFSGYDGINGSELWKSDGTTAGTVMVKDINPLGGSNPGGGIMELNGSILFAADDGVHGNALWKTDGTEAGTVMVKDINTVGNTYIYLQFVDNIVNGILYFVADNGSTGFEIWKTDGTTEGTALLKVVATGNSFVTELTGLETELYFNLKNTEKGDQLWKTDGTEAGTVVVKDNFETGDFATNQALYLRKGDDEVFAINIDFTTYNTEIWSFGAKGCRRAAESDLLANNAAVAGGKVFMQGVSHALGGYELFVYDAASDPCKNAQTINFQSLPFKRANDEPFTITAAASSGLPVTFTSSNADVATIAGNTVTIVGVGETEITAIQDGDAGTWEPATPVTRTLEVGITVSVEVGEHKRSAPYPNPFTDSFVFRIDAPGHESAEVSVLTLTGSAVHPASMLKTNTDHHMGRQWPGGMYVVKVKAGEKVYIQKVVKK
jgi:ELWxxDGT repeat protein